MNPTSRKVFFILSAVVLLFWLLRVMNGHYRLVDSNGYVWTAKMIQTGSYFTPTEDVVMAGALTSRPFVYPVFIMLLAYSDAFIAAMQNILAILNIYLALLIFQQTGGKKANSLFVLLMLFTPSIFIYTHLLMSEVFVCTSVLLLAFLLSSTLTSRNIIYVQLIIGVLCFTKPVFYLFTFINVLFWMGYWYKTKKTAALTSLIPVLLVMGYLQFNAYRTGYAQFSSMQTINLIDYNVKYFKIHQSGDEEATRWQDSIIHKADAFQNFKARSEFMNRAGMDCISENLFSYTLFHFIGSVRGMLDPGRFDLATFFEKPPAKEGFLLILNNEGLGTALHKTITLKNAWLPVLLLMIVLAAILKYLLIGRYLLFHYKDASAGLILMCIFLVYTIAITGPLNASRFMMPLQPVLIVFAALSWEQWRQKNKNPL